MISKISKYRPSIFQSKLDFSGTREMILPGEWAYERSVLRGIILFIVALAFLYIYFVTASVLNVIASREARQSITKLQGSIGTLEQEYFALSQKATLAEGERIGLTRVASPQYVYRPGNVGTATIASNAI